MGTRRKSRELVVQMLFQSDMGKQDPEQTRKIFWSERQEMEEDVRDFANDIFRVATDRAAEIDQIIEAHAPNWKVDRMAAVDRNVIRGAVAEMVGFKTPGPVVINEAIEIARKFSSPEAINFINAVLDSVSKDIKSTKDDVRRTT